jgi:hypothetical protein
VTSSAPWPKTHRVLALLTGLLLLAALALYAAVIRPKQREVARAQAHFDELHASLRQSGWPLDSSRLSSLSEAKAKELQRLVRQSDDILQLATCMFDPRINAIFGDADTFRNSVSRLDYKEDFIQAEQHFAKLGVTFAESILRLSENSDSPYTYQLMLQLWTLTAVTDLALKNGLLPVKDRSIRIPAEEESARSYANASRLSVLPMRAYVTHPEEKQPYLLEFPVRLVLRGQVANLTAFLRDLHGAYALAVPEGQAEAAPKGNFFPVTRLEIRKVTPYTPNQDTIEADIECSAFYRLRGVAAPRAPGRLTPPPRGA